MSCTNPLYAKRLGVINTKTGKEKIKILPRSAGDYFYLCDKFGKDNIIPVACGKCSSCIESRSKSWALRCVCEAIYHENNCFLTLTYNDKCLPKFLCKKDVQRFIKKLRYRFPDVDVRYFGCSEFGEHTHRLHHHLIIFGLFPDDAKFVTVSKAGGSFYTSKKIQDCWPFGFVSVGDFSYASAAYVARYTQKKLDDPNFHGCSYMSLKPGIGAQYFYDNKDKIYKYDVIVSDFGRSLRQRPSKYFDKLFERFDEKSFQLLKAQRISKANSQVISDLLDHGFQYYEELIFYQRNIKNRKMSILNRKEL